MHIYNTDKKTLPPNLLLVTRCVVEVTDHGLKVYGSARVEKGGQRKESQSSDQGSLQSTWSVTGSDPSFAYVTRRRRRSLGGSA